jgi:hypothetical protein
MVRRSFMLAACDLVPESCDLTPPAYLKWSVQTPLAPLPDFSPFHPT